VRTIDCGGFLVRVPGDWRDITGDLDAGSPVTLALPDGVGALQFSSALYVSGAVPAPTSKDLGDLLTEFAGAQDLGLPREPTREDVPHRLAAATFSQPDAVVRVWYVSDGLNLARVTYTCLGASLQRDELRECETIVRTIMWPGTG
jgi:hypothetical protein